MKKKLILIPLISSLPVLSLEGLYQAIFKVKGNSVQEGMKTVTPPFLYNWAKLQTNLGALSRMIIKANEMNGFPLNGSIAYARSLKQEEYTIKNAHGHKLYGTLYKTKKPTDRYVFFSHGFNMTGLTDSCRYIREYNKLGLNVFVVDHRHEGRSEGDVVTFGDQESKDCVLWLQFLEKVKGPKIKVMLHGVSMGSSTALLTAAHPDLPKSVKCLIADCGYTSAKDEFYHVLRAFHLPKTVAALLVTALANYYHLRSGYNLEDAAPIEHNKDIKIPTMIMHGDDDIFVPVTMGYENYESLTCPRELHIFPNTSHSASQFNYNNEYFTYIKQYINKYL